MGGVAGGRLAAAVTAAGGLGMVGMGSAATRASLQTELQHVRFGFGIGLGDWVIHAEPGLFDDALAARPVLLSVRFGADWSWVGRAHDAGIATTTQVFDVAMGLPWPVRFPSRVLANDFVARWTGREDALAADRGARAELEASIAADDCRVAPVDAGQGVGMIRDDAPVGRVIEQMCAGAESLLGRWGA